MITNKREWLQAGWLLAGFLWLALGAGCANPQGDTSRRAAAQEQTSEEREQEGNEIFAQLKANPGDPQLRERALALIEAELRENPGDPATLDLRCIYRAQWQTSDALPDCTEAVSAKRDPNDEFSSTPYMVLEYRGFVYLCLDMPEKALQDFDARAELSLPTTVQWLVGLSGGRGSPVPSFYQGVAHRRLGNERQAKLFFNMAIEPIVADKMAKFYPQCMVDLLREMHLMQ